MTPEQFIAKWQAWTGSERAGAQSHFLDLCALLEEPPPSDPEAYCFEKGASKTQGGRGWADVWKRGHFAIEYKQKGANLQAALGQLQQYALALENPPLLVVCDFERFLIVTNWTNAVSERREIRLEELRDPLKLRVLKQVLADPEKLRPTRTRQQLTEEVASEVGQIAQDLRAKGHDPQKVAHFVIRLVFCMFAEDVGLFQEKVITKMLTGAARYPDRFEGMLRGLFAAMRDDVGHYGLDTIPWFDGGLFDSDDVLPLSEPIIRAALKAAKRDWSEIDASIMGTLFERGLDPAKRGQLGKFYTDRDKIMLIVEPVIVRPLQAEWAERKQRIAALMAEAAGRSGKAAEAMRAEAREIYAAHLHRLRRFKVLDPACGSGNFLNLALQTLKDLEWQVLLEAEELGLGAELRRSEVGPHQMLGLEINDYACEVARASVWIADIQWLTRHGMKVERRPILQKLDTIQCRDALLNENGTEAEWPEADVIIGNPPFLGGKMLRKGLGDAEVERLFAAFDGKVPREADLVCYWFEKATAMLADSRLDRFGFVSTNSIRGGANRKLLEKAAEVGRITDAWSDEAWWDSGTAVRVSMTTVECKDLRSDTFLNGRSILLINTDLTGGRDFTIAKQLQENSGIGFMGDTKGGAFEIDGNLARKWLKEPLNANGRPNSDVLKPWNNGIDVTRRNRDMWIIDFGIGRTESDASFYQKPYEYAVRIVRPDRVGRQIRGYAKRWWEHERPRPEMLARLANTKRCLVTPEVSRYRSFAWLDKRICPDHKLFAFTRDDDCFAGVLLSTIHLVWSLRLGSWHGAGNDPRYTITTTFETFPFPEGLTPNIPAPSYAADPRAVRIAEVAERLNRLREAWLNPPDLVVRVPEVVPGYPDRILPVDEKAATVLKKRTLTNLYNERPAWLDAVHKELDAAVAAAYGWPADLSDEQILERLLALNLERAAAGR